MKTWKPWIAGDCDNCGDDTEVFTDCKRDGCAYDGDDVRCIDPACPARGTVCVDDSASDEDESDRGLAHTHWNDYAAEGSA